MDVEQPLQVVDFITEKDLKKTKPTKKRKRVGNRLKIGEKHSKRSATQQSPKAAPKPVVESESDEEESGEEEQVDNIDAASESSSDAESTAPNTFSGALEALLGRAEARDADEKPELQILKDAPKLKTEEDEEAARAARQAREASRIAVLQRKLFKNKDHKVPDFSGAELESKLRKVATRGVVKLFNAIKQHQKSSAASEALTAVTRKTTDDAVKRKFMDSLKRTSGTADQRKSLEAQNGSADENSDTEAPLPAASTTRRASIAKKSASGAAAPSWEVLRDDYLLGAKMKDWNKESDEE